MIKPLQIASRELHQGRVVRWEWRSPHACVNSPSVRGLSQDGSPVTGGFACEWP